MLSEMAERHRAPSAHHPLRSLRSAPSLPSLPSPSHWGFGGPRRGFGTKSYAFSNRSGKVPNCELKPPGYSPCLGLHTACSCCPGGGHFGFSPSVRVRCPRLPFPSPLPTPGLLCAALPAKAAPEGTGDAFGAARPSHRRAARGYEFGPAGTGADPVLGATRGFLHAEARPRAAEHHARDEAVPPAP